MTQEENNTLEAEVIEVETNLAQQKITIDPYKFLKRMMARGWRTSTGKKNLSPNRVEKRRKRKKLANKSKKRQ